MGFEPKIAPTPEARARQVTSTSSAEGAHIPSFIPTNHSHTWLVRQPRVLPSLHPSLKVIQQPGPHDAGQTAALLQNDGASHRAPSTRAKPGYSTVVPVERVPSRLLEMLKSMPIHDRISYHGLKHRHQGKFNVDPSSGGSPTAHFPFEMRPIPYRSQVKT